MKLTEEDILEKIMPTNAGAHNSIYRGKDITELWYSGKLSEEIANEDFTHVFVGDYITGESSDRKYLVADINYYLGCGDTECTTSHILMIPELSMGTAQMNSSNITTGGYVGSEMYTTNLEDFKTIIKNDFTADHILTHREYLIHGVANSYPTEGNYYDSDIDLMNENMVYGSNIFAPMTAYNGSSITIPINHKISNSQLALFRLNHSKITAFNDSGSKQNWWLRDVVSNTYFSTIGSSSESSRGLSSSSYGIRPAFAIY